MFYVEMYTYQKDQKVHVIFTYLSQEERKFYILASILSRRWR